MRAPFNNPSNNADAAGDVVCAGADGVCAGYDRRATASPRQRRRHRDARSRGRDGTRGRRRADGRWRDRLRTERGRAELLFPDGSVIDLDEYTTIELEGPTLLRMTSGRALLFAAGSNNPASAIQFQIDTPVASAQTDGPGEYRVSILGGPSAWQTEMAVVRGGGALVTERWHDAATIRRTQRRRGTTRAPSRPQLFNSARYDAFDQWAMALRDQRLGSRSQSAQYLPADLRMYGGELDRSGAWDYEAHVRVRLVSNRHA